MATRAPKRNEWHQAAGKWSKSLGSRGMRVRLFQKRIGGVFYRAVWVAETGRDIASLNTSDRVEAERRGKLLLAALLNGAQPRVAGPVRLGELWDRFRRECSTFLDNGETARYDAERQAAVLLAFFGSERDVRQLTAHDVAQYVAARRRGGITLAGSRKTKGVRQRSVQADLSLLRQMLRWACTVTAPGGGRWLESNPLQGVRLERERNPARSIATYDRVLKLRSALRDWIDATGPVVVRARWQRLDLAVALAEATGRRRGAIVSLRWEDFDFQRGTICWRAEHDKTGAESVVPMPEEFMSELRRFRTAMGAISGPLFPSVRHPGNAMPATMLDQWLRAAETGAGLPKLKGSLWHAFRRKWATERKDLPLCDVMAAGGWKDHATLLTCYQQADEASMLRVMASPAKLVSRKISGSEAMVLGETAPQTAPRR